MKTLTLPVGHDSSAVIASVSGGKDSTALLCALRESGIPHRAVFSDTGWEAPETYDYLGTIEKTFGITIVRVGVPGGMRAKILNRAGFPARKQRWCTRELKVKPLDTYARGVAEVEQCDVIQAVGIRADESESRAKMLDFEHDGSRDLFVWRPLMRWSVEQVLAAHHRHGLPVNPLYQRGHNRVGCYPCIYAGKQEIRLWAEHAPERVQEVRELESLCESLREVRNAETPGRYSHETASFFQAREVTVVNGEKKYLPVHVDRIIEWAQTSRGGRQLPLIREEPDGGCFRWGMCEPPANDDAESEAA